MHRSIEITSPPERTQHIVERVSAIEEVLGVAIWKGASIKPPGDVIAIQVLNKAANNVMQVVAENQEHGVTAAVAEIASLTDPEHQEMIEHDVDEEVWEDFETGLRHTTNLTVNYLALMALGGAIATVGLFEHGVPQATAFVASSIIAPGFEPLAKIPAGLVLRSVPVALRALYSFAAGYCVLFLSSGLTYWLLRVLNEADITAALHNPDLASILQNTAPQNAISVCAALAGIIMISSYREEVIAGPLIAIALIQSAAVAGVALAAWNGEALRLSLLRFVIDVSAIVAMSAAWIALKQKVFHRRRPMF